jgi:polar amino acid transport system substrate-binding protein
MIRRPFRALGVLFAVWVGAVGGSVSAGETLARVINNGKLVVATDANYPPQSSRSADGTLEGFDVDVATAIAARLGDGVEVEFVTPQWDMIVTGFWGGAWDISVGSMTPTTARRQLLDFPAIYYYTPAVFAVPLDTDVRELSDLNEKAIGVCHACTYEDYLRKQLMIDAIGVPSFDYVVTPGAINDYDTDGQAFAEMRDGRLDAVLAAQPSVVNAIESGYPIRILGEPVFYEPLAIAIDKGDSDFADEIRRIVESLHTDGTLTELSKKWYGLDYSQLQKSGQQ